MGGILPRRMARKATGIYPISAMGLVNPPTDLMGSRSSSSRPVCPTDSVKASVWRAPLLFW